MGRSEESLQSFLEGIRQELVNKTYRPSKVPRRYIEKENGKLRPLGTPTVKDRVVQTAVVLLLEPIFVADFEDCSFGFRPGRSAHDALERLGDTHRAAKCAVNDADLQGYFDSIPHEKFNKCIRMQVVDGTVLKLIRSKGAKRPIITRNDKGTP